MEKQSDLSTRWGSCWLNRKGASILESLQIKGLWLPMFQKERKKSFMTLQYNLAFFFNFVGLHQKPTQQIVLVNVPVMSLRSNFTSVVHEKGARTTFLAPTWRLTLHPFTPSAVIFIHTCTHTEAKALSGWPRSDPGQRHVSSASGFSLRLTLSCRFTYKLEFGIIQFGNQ